MNMPGELRVLLLRERRRIYFERKEFCNHSCEIYMRRKSEIFGEESVEKVNCGWWRSVVWEDGCGRRDIGGICCFLYISAFNHPDEAIESDVSLKEEIRNVCNKLRGTAMFLPRKKKRRRWRIKVRC